MLASIQKTILDLLFPLSCIGCGAHDSLVCAGCLNSIPLLIKLVEHPTPHLDFVIIAGNYEHPLLKELVTLYKFHGVTELAEPLAGIMGRALAVFPVQTAPVLVPVPLHWKRARARGYNQSELLARRLAENRGCNTQNLLRRVKATRSQAKLGRTERLKNVAGVFRGIGAVPTEVMLIDDIATTFATLESAAGELKKHGAKHVGGLVIAKNNA
ncbi:MAG: ComF family protein [Candidatus Komeilibacteria bacterium]|nr:ComF family protein [Candidatus Komeilibacteria bacterium]